MVWEAGTRRSMASPNLEMQSPSSNESQRNARYVYLLGRLRTRQITMEEATELFGTMQGMLRTSESGRLAALAQATTPTAAPSAPRTAPVSRPAPSGSSDDMFLVGLLAMGAGAGLLAALSKRITEGPDSGTAPSRARTGTGGSTR